MNKIYLIGDSIRMGYCGYVRDLLKDSAETLWPEDNCRFTQYTLRYLHEWAAAVPMIKTVKAVHWNNGAWDAICHTADGLPITEPDIYERNIKRIIGEIEALFPCAEIVFANTIPSDKKHPCLLNTRIDEYNRIASQIMASFHIPINDLHALVAAHPEYISSDLIHPTQEGFRALGAQTARILAKYCV